MSALFPLSVRGATTRRRGKVLVGPVDLDLDTEGITVVVGPNGAGKTSLMRLLHGTARLHAGTINWACDVKTARNAQAFVFQRPVMLRRSVWENLAYPLVIRGVPRREAKARALDWAKRVGLAGMFDRPAPVLSGGEQQKLAIARALISEPELIFLDEPCASLEGRATREIEEILMAARDAGTRLLLSTHDMGQVRRLADRVLFLLAGRVHEDASASEFFAGPNTREAKAFVKGDIVE